MSTDTVESKRSFTGTQSSVWMTLRTTLFGDRLGLCLFLASLCLFALFWRTTVFITDTYTLANGLYSLSNGHLTLTEAVYGPGLSTPGAEPYDGELIARNYGAIVLSLPFLWGIEVLDAVTDIRIALVALWSLALLALVVQLGVVTARSDVVVGGSLAVLCLFVLNVALATPLELRPELYALQLFHMTVAAFAPVLLYRLVARLHTVRIGTVAGLLLVAGTPIAFWAAVPKRHVVTATVVLGVAYALYRSREPARGPVLDDPRYFRATAYALVGLYAWVQAPEALLLLCVLGVVDVSTADRNDPQTLLLLGGAFGLSLVPFLVTNTLVAGSPVRPPRLLAVGGSGATETVASGATGTSGSSGGGTPVMQPLLEALDPVLSPLLLLGDELVVGLETGTERPTDVFHAFVRSGSSPDVLNNADEESVNLALLESAPVLAALTAVVPAVRHWKRPDSLPARTLSARRVVDLYAALTFVAVAVFYASRLPIHAQVTVRYLFPMFPLGVYLLVRLPAVRCTLADHWRVFCWTLAVGILVGGQLVVAAVAVAVNGVGEAFQLHALLALSTALPLGAWALLGRTDRRGGRVGAVLLGLATSSTALFGILAAVEYYALGDTHAIPMVRVLGELLRLL